MVYHKQNINKELKAFSSISLSLSILNNITSKAYKSRKLKTKQNKNTKEEEE